MAPPQERATSFIRRQGSLLRPLPPIRHTGPVCIAVVTVIHKLFPFPEIGRVLQRASHLPGFGTVLAHQPDGYCRWTVLRHVQAAEQNVAPVARPTRLLVGVARI